MEKISWNTQEYFHTEKTADWYWIVGIVTLAVAAISIILNNVIFAILILVSSFTLSLFASRRPATVTVLLDSFGVTFGRTRYPYSNLEAFWIEMENHHPRLLLKSKKMIMPLIIILIENIDEEEIRQFLKNHLPEEEMTEPLLEKLLIYFGF